MHALGGFIGPTVCRTYLGDSLEQDRLVSRALGEAECADGLGALVLVCDEEVIQACVAEILQEPLAVWEYQVSYKRRLNRISFVRLLYKNVHVWARQSVQCVEAEAGIFDQHRASYLES